VKGTPITTGGLDMGALSGLEQVQATFAHNTAAEPAALSVKGAPAQQRAVRARFLALIRG